MAAFKGKNNCSEKKLFCPSDWGRSRFSHRV